MHHLRRGIHYLLILSFALLAGCDKDNDPAINVEIPNDFLAGNNYPSLVIEVVSVTGNQPTSEAIDNLKAFLAARLNKPSGITVMQSSISSPGFASLTVQQIRDLEKVNRKQTTKGNVLTAYFFFADVEYASNSGNSKVLGAAYDHSSMVIFEKSIKEFSGDIGQPSVASLETTVINHEFAHILGLVNNGTPVQSAHQDTNTANGKHCANQNCLMHYSAETSDVIANLMGGVPGLDANCIADLKANGGK